MSTSTITETRTDTAPPRPRNKPPLTWDRVQRRGFGILRWVVIAGFLIATLVPFYYMLLLSVKPIESLLSNPDSLIVSPSEFTLQTYVDVLTSVDNGGQGFGRFLVNSAFVALFSVALALLIGIPGSYAIARLPFIGRQQVSGIFLAAYLFPAILMAIPLFVGFTRIGLRGSLVGLVLVYTAQTVPVAIYMMRNYFETVPESVEEAGMVDGLTRLGVLRHISLKLAMPSIMSTGLFVFMIAWNVLTLPIIIIFFFTERLLTGGLTAGAEK